MVSVRPIKKQLISEKNEETKNHRAGGEGGSSRAHGIPHGTGHNQLHELKSETTT